MIAPAQLGSQQISSSLVNSLNGKREPLVFPIYCKSLMVLVVARSYLHFNFLEHVFYGERLSKETQSLVAWLEFLHCVHACLIY